jgi:hypothetical protein
MTAPTSSGEPRPDPRRRRWGKWLLYGAAALFVASCCLLLPCTSEIRDSEGWVRSAVSLKRIGIALHTYHDVNGRLPPAVVTDKDGRPLYSWRVLLLPYLEDVTLYKQFHLDEAWDGPNNMALLDKTPRCYVPALGGNDAPGLTRYQVFVGPGTAFERDGLTWGDFPDGPGNTLLVVEAGQPVPWSKPADLAYAPDEPLPPLGGLFTKPVHFLCFEVWRKQGFNACFGDGNTHFISSTTDEKTIRAFITRNGGEKVDASQLE